MPLENVKTLSKDNLKQKVKKNQKKKSTKVRFYHSFLTIVLILCVCQIAYSALLNISKIVIYQTKIVKSKKLLDRAQERNTKLKKDIENFNSMAKIEEFARNNLKMAAEDEIFLQITSEHEIKEKLVYYFTENVANKFIYNDSSFISN